MRKIQNPFLHKDGYNCFGCAPQNALGLQMTFYEDGDQIVSFWTPQPQFQGWINTLHGGITSTLIDEVAYWTICRKLQTAAVTAKLSVNFRLPIDINEEQLTLKAKITSQKAMFVSVEVKVYNAKQQLCAEGEALYRTMSKDVSTEMGFTSCELEGDPMLPL